MFAELSTDPVFWALAVVAVTLTGISKGGLGGMAILSVPLLSLRISPVEAAAVMLPILVVMDWTGLLAYRRHWDRGLVKLILPAALVGVGVGWALAGSVSENGVRIAVGVVAVAFPLWQWFGPARGIESLRGSRIAGVVAGVVAGFTSFVAHAGGPPFKAYALAQGLPPRIFAGTSVVVFTAINAAKLIPYAALGQLGTANLATSLVLVPLAPLGVLLGVWLVKRMDATVFYRIIYALVFATGCKLLWDGLF